VCLSRNKDYLRKKFCQSCFKDLDSLQSVTLDWAYAAAKKLFKESQLHVIYAGNNSIFSGNQINTNATHNNIDINNSTLQITTDKQRYVPGETVGSVSVEQPSIPFTKAVLISYISSDLFSA
jgi:hypothetical protein